MGTVHITFPRQRRIFVGGNYDDAAGTSECSIVVPTGRKQRFETLNGDGLVDYRGFATPTASDPVVDLALARLDEPEEP